MDVLQIVLGFLLLILGHQSYSIYSGGIAALAAIYVFTNFYPIPDAGAFTVAVGAVGLTAALLAVLLRRWLAALASFIAGGFILYGLVDLASASLEFSWLYYGLAGAISLALFMALDDWAMILISVLVGSILVVQVLPPWQVSSVNILIGVAILSLAIQVIIHQYSPLKST